MAIFSPSLKIKAGEIQALIQYAKDADDVVQPLFDVVRPTAKTPVDKRIAESAELLISGGWCKPSRSFFVDTYDIPPGLMLADGSVPITALARKISLYNYRPTYCFGFGRGTEYEHAFVQLVQVNMIQNIALRLELQDLVLIEDTLGRIRSFLSQVNRDLRDVPVFFDLRSVDEGSIGSVRICENAYARLKRLGATTQIFLASAMWDWSRLKTERINRVPRADFALWHAMRQLGVEIRYGDYGVISPQFSEPDGKKIIPAPKLRYCTNSMWLVAKGERPRKGEGNQYPRLARRLMKDPDFRHTESNWGHEQLRVMESYGFDTVGHHTAVAIDTFNHLLLVARQVTATEWVLAESGASPTSASTAIPS